jgi:hypothetical protein
MVETLISWPTFIAALILYGFAPGALLRVICLAFHRDDPRREELRAELYAVPRLERPFWVLEQLEVALFEGIGNRVYWAATGRIIHRWSLTSGVEQNRLYPETFWIPDESLKDEIVPGTRVKLMFEMNDGYGERMWVDVTSVKKNRLAGTLSNTPALIPRLAPGDKIKFHRDDIIDIVPNEIEGRVVPEQFRLAALGRLAHGCRRVAPNLPEPDARGRPTQ